jgi:hypothetical protein
VNVLASGTSVPKQLKDVRVGDRVEAVGSQGRAKWSEVYWMDKHDEVVHMIEVCAVDSRHGKRMTALVLTPDHLMYS